jgi:hypothetical protein
MRSFDSDVIKQTVGRSVHHIRLTTGTAILSDIGIASIPQPPEWNFKTGDDARWLAPEVLYPSLRPEVEEGEGFNARKTVTYESDVYAFGMVSYEVSVLQVGWVHKFTE